MKGRPPTHTGCTVDRCGRKHWARGYCAMHYKRSQRTGVVRPADAPQLKVANVGSVCSIPCCDRPAEYRAYCGGHYLRLRAHGGPLANTPIRAKREPGTGGRWLDGNGYVVLTQPQRRRRVAEHRQVMEQLLGRDLLPGETVHHRNGVRTDNRPENLELWVSTQPAGQRVDDLLAWAETIIARYRK